MPPSDQQAKLDEADYSGARAAWGVEFNAREDSLEATWELAGIEERWGDSLFFGGAAGARAHYQAAQRALMPPGVTFDAGEESSRRMEAYGRLTNKLYAVGPDDKARPASDAQAHPMFRPLVAPTEASPDLPQPEGEKAVAPRKLPPRQSGLGLLYRDSDHWCHYSLGEAWFGVAQELSPRHPSAALRACQWSRYYFQLYSKSWEAHLPASRWDSDGVQEVEQVQALEKSLAGDDPESPSPDWVSRMLDGDWQSALVALAGETPEARHRSLAAMVAEAARAAGTT